MKTVFAQLSNPFMWSADWEWSLPLIVLTAVVHVSVLMFISQRAVHVAGRMIERGAPTLASFAVIGVMTLLATCLHGIEAGIWAAAYYFLGALPDFRSAVLYSLNAITSFGHANLTLEYHWQLMGALEALNGCLLFGLTTACLFAVVARVWKLGNNGTTHH